MKTVVFLKSPTCAPCKQLEPMMREVCQEQGLELVVWSITEPEGRTFAEDVGARQVPTYALLDEDEELLKVSQGTKTKAQLEEWVKND